ncbi:hypothetical protein B0O99DRAFT_645359 [Bisporella sp. PMI_857]|nr:hypothetical protein B0O99DRAFT_645359 [Bisporella sp. PMI_857]
MTATTSLSRQHQRRAIQSNFDYRNAARLIPILPKYSYLKIDSDYEVPIQMLVEERDCLDNPLIVWSKHQGRLGELRDHLRRRDLIREKEKLYSIIEKHNREAR